METTKRLHPLVAAASASVILVSLVGVAALTGMLPTSNGQSTASSPVQTAQAPTAPAAPTTLTAQAPDARTDAARSTTQTDLAKDDPVVERAPKRVVQPPVASAPRSPSPRPQPTQQAATQAAVTSPMPAAPVYAPPPQQVAQAPICHECGRIEAVHVIQPAQPTSGMGVVGGAVLGGLLGNQVGGGNGRAIATVAGAVGGGYAGNEIERRTQKPTYQVRVRMEDGQVRSFPFDNAPSWNVGDRVRVVNGYLRVVG